MGLPEGEMGRERKHVEHTITAASTGKLHETKARGSQESEVVSSVNKRNRIGRPSCRARHEDWPKLAIQLPSSSTHSRQETAKNRQGTSRELLWIWSDNKSPGLLRPARQVFFGGKGNFLKILEFFDDPPSKPVLAKEILIMRMEWQHHVAQVGAKLLRLQLTKRLPRQLVPTSLESFGVHEGVR